MVEQTRRQRRVVSLQAGPSEADTSSNLLDVNLRISDRAARVFGRQLAFIGDQLNQEVSSRQTNWIQTPLQLLRPLTRTMYRDFHSFQGLCAAVKAWIESMVPGQGVLRAEGVTAWVCGFKPVPCAGWTLLAAALVAAVSILTSLWMEQKTS